MANKIRSVTIYINEIDTRSIEKLDEYLLNETSVNYTLTVGEPYIEESDTELEED